MTTLSIRWRLTLWVVALMAAALSAFGAGVMWLHVRWTRAEFDAGLQNVAATAARMIDEEFSETGNFTRAVAEVRESLNVPGLATAVLDGDGRPMAAHWHGLDSRRVTEIWTRSERTRFQTSMVSDTPWRVLLQPETTAAGPYTLVIARPMDESDRQQVVLLRVLLIAGATVVLLTGIISWWVASSALRPVTTMAQQAHVITADSPDWRLDGATASDELGQLARAFNALLARLAQAAKIQRDFMADASHELRTPVSVIKTAAEVTLDRPTRDEDEYREALTIIQQQSTRLSRLVEDMFVLARADADGQAIVMRRIDLSAIVADCARAAGVVAAAKGIHLSAQIDADQIVVGNDDLLRRLVTNLLDNALQYTPEGGSVDVAVARAGSRVRVKVADTGPGVPVHERDRIFERFVRLDVARSATAGAGLGLPIARWIARGHGGTLAVDDRDGGGSVFTFQLAAEPGASPGQHEGSAMRTSTRVLCSLALLLAAPAAYAQSADGSTQDQPARPQAIEYSEGYETRAKIHKIASYATLPLLATEAILGENLYNDPQGRLSSYRGAHIAVGTAITGLFAVQTVTGVWNLVEGWKDPHHKTLRLVHGIMMLGADAGFAAAYATGPGGRNLVNFDQNKSTHRTVVFTTMGVATASYLLMVFGNK